MKTALSALIGLALARFPLDVPASEPKPMRDEGLPQPYQYGAKPTTYKPSPCNPPRCGSKRKRQWR
jgi:hypothetical protein